MGFGVSVATAIIAIGIILTVTVHYERVSGSYESLHDATDAKQARMTSVLDTAIEIYNTSACLCEGKGKIDHKTGNEYFHIKNTGTTSINVSDLNVLVNGAIVSPDPPWSGWLYPGKTFNATLELDVSNDDVKIITANGRSARAEVV